MVMKALKRIGKLLTKDSGMENRLLVFELATIYCAIAISMFIQSAALLGVHRHF